MPELNIILSTIGRLRALSADQRFARPGQKQSDWTGLSQVWIGLAWTEGYSLVQARLNMSKPVQSWINQRTDQSRSVQSRGVLGITTEKAEGTEDGGGTTGCAGWDQRTENNFERTIRLLFFLSYQMRSNGSIYTKSDRNI